MWVPPPPLQTCQWWDEAAKALQRDVAGLGRQLEAVRLREERSRQLSAGGTRQLVVRRGICRPRDTHTHTQSGCPQSVPGQPWGLPCTCHLVLASLGSGLETGTVNSGSPLTPDPSSLIDCEEEPGPLWRGEQEGTFSPRAAEASRRHKRGSLAVQRQYFAVHSKRASSCLWILSVLLIVSKSCCSWWLPPSSCWICSALGMLRVSFLTPLEGVALSCLPFV